MDDSFERIKTICFIVCAVGGGYSFTACLSHVATDHAPLSRRNSRGKGYFSLFVEAGSSRIAHGSMTGQLQENRSVSESGNEKTGPFLTLAVDHDESREVLHVDLPHRFHTQLGVLQDLHLLIEQSSE